ncbi:thioester domain-containing protein [Actinomadura parmotrematis]|uniref:Thioester domain-containing protein n=1 Tax=Actinomadura parmotrematis TaxID=2864039 RepID=A0ABS7FUV7_9ACTN|nr:thioester domain-containing protein [Actinomadura parmotrematis]MBW8484111.1 thioester domain-containing protein [Actinomadura parmotrematis]
MKSRSALRPFAVLSAVMLALTCVQPAARADVEPGAASARRAGFFTDAQLTGLGSGQTVTTAYDAPASLDPRAGYPAALPAGSTGHGGVYAGTIQITDQGTGGTALVYCIDLHTTTTFGVNYELGTWNQANVPNNGYVGYILQHYFPGTGEPSSAPDDASRAAAVQLAIWFLTDKLVLAPDDPRYAAVSAIVADALKNGPAKEPVTPQLSVTPATMRAPSTGGVVGPFTVTGNGPATLTPQNVTVYADAAGRRRLAPGDVVQPGAKLWVSSDGPGATQGFVLERTVDVAASAVYLYDGGNPGLEKAQKLILAEKERLTERAGALITRYDAGTLNIDKNVQGSGAGLQGAITLQIACTDPDRHVTRYTRTLRAGARSGHRTLSVTGIVAGSTCAVTEPADGENGRVAPRAAVIEPAQVTIPTDDTVKVAVTDTYDRATGGVRITKTIRGTGAGHQGRITVELRCAGVNRRFHLAAGSPRGTHPVAEITGLPAGTACTVTEPDRGENRKVHLDRVRIRPATVTVLKGTTREVRLTDVYTRVPGPVK